MFDWVTDVLEWLLSLALWWPLKVWELLLAGLAAAINAIPVPAPLVNLVGAVADLAGVAGYFFDVIMLGPGLGIVFLAYVIRFSIRRIPVVG